MFRTALILALSALALPAAAFEPGFDSDDAVAFAPRGKAELPERTGPRDLGDDPVEEFDLLDDEAEVDEPDFLGDFSDSDDDLVIDLIDPEPPARKQASSPAPKGPGPINLEVAGREPLADNYPLQVVAVDRDAVVVELPVLVASSSNTVEEGFLLIAEVFSDDERVSRIEQRIEPNSLATFGPSFSFFRVMAPVSDKEGQVTIKVSKTDLEGQNATELFSRATPYAL